MSILLVESIMMSTMAIMILLLLPLLSLVFAVDPSVRETTPM